MHKPLTGPVYAVSGSGGLPRLALLLDGQVSLIPRARTETVKGGLMTTVPVVPDAPIGHFRLTVFGGKHGYLLNTRDTCSKVPEVKDRLHGAERPHPCADSAGQGPLWLLAQGQASQARQALSRALGREGFSAWVHSLMFEPADPEGAAAEPR